MQNSTNSLWQKLNIPEVEYHNILKRLGREPNMTETFIFSAMWSEHCGYKHSKKQLAKLPRCSDSFSEENAGGIKIGEHYLFFKAESHNHPSAVEPYQGAATGVGGIVRDIMALGARPIALMDSLKFSYLNHKRSKYLLKGVVSGISDYGNSIGVPTIGGETIFDNCYLDSPLVNVFAAGIVHKDDIMLSSAKENCTIVLIGSFTGRDGIHGASFASKELHSDSQKDRPSVQIGDPFVKKQLIEAIVEIAELECVIACQDCGAAGILSSTTEMAYKGNCSIELHLDKVHMREAEMQPWEILLSESQERMVLAIKPEGIAQIQSICQKYGLECSIIGRTKSGNCYQIIMNGKEYANLPVDILNEPYLYDLEPKHKDTYYKNKSLPAKDINITDAIKRMVSEPNIASKEWIYSQYDYMVGNRTIGSPDLGVANLWIYEEDCAVGFTFDSLPAQVFLEPYKGTQNTIWNSFRKLVSRGYEPKGFTNCLNYGNPQKNDVAYQFTQSIEAMVQTVKDTGVPVVSGNVSFYNESENTRVYPTPTIGMAGVIKDLKTIISPCAKENDTIILIGKQINDKSKTGGSLYHKVLYDFVGEEVDQTDVELELSLKQTIEELNNDKLLSSCQPISCGGLFLSLLKMLFHNKTGFNGSLIFCNDKLKALFGEINGRYLIATNNPEQAIKSICKHNTPYKILGTCVGDTIKFDDYTFSLDELSDLYFNKLEIEMSK